MGLEWIDVVALITSGLAVGFINTIAGGGTVISVSVFMLLGLPPLVANGTNRIAILMQNITSVYYFHKKKLIDWSKISGFAIPIVLGSLVGASLAYFITNEIFNYIFAGAIFLFALSLFFQPQRWENENSTQLKRRYTWAAFLIYFLVGIYGGLVHVGIGYVILALMVLYNGRNLTSANIMKNILVMVYVPFPLVIFAFQGNVDWGYGLVHGVGNVIGAYLAARISVQRGAGFIRYFVLFIVILALLQLMGVLTPDNVVRAFSS